MTIMKTAVFFLFSFLPFCMAAQESFEIRGRIGAYNDPVKVYLVYRIDGKLVLDSAKPQQGAFLFKGRVPAIIPAGLVLDRTPAGFSKLSSLTADMRTFYLGNESFTVSGDDSMKNIVITGSHINDSVAAAASAAARKAEEEIKNLQPGKIAPLFTQPDSTGKLVKLDDFRGKIVLLDFWASWCMPCRHENPNLVKAYQKYKEKGFEILSISLDDAAHKRDWLDAVKKDNMQWKHASDLKGGNLNEAAALYHIEFIPQNWLIDRDGKIIAVNLFGDALEKELEKIYSKNNP